MLYLQFCSITKKRSSLLFFSPSRTTFDLPISTTRTIRVLPAVSVLHICKARYHAPVIHTWSNQSTAEDWRLCAFDTSPSFNRNMSALVDYAFRSDSDNGSFILQPNMNTFKQTYDMHREFVTFAVLQYIVVFLRPPISDRLAWIKPC